MRDFLLALFVASAAWSAIGAMSALIGLTDAPSGSREEWTSRQEGLKGLAILLALVSILSTGLAALVG